MLARLLQEDIDAISWTISRVEEEVTPTIVVPHANTGIGGFHVGRTYGSAFETDMSFDLMVESRYKGRCLCEWSYDAHAFAPWKCSVADGVDGLGSLQGR